MSDLTVVSVSTHEERYLEENWNLTKQLNPDEEFSWLVVNNASSEFQNGFANHAFSVIQGPAYPQERDGAGSYHHAQALNKAMSCCTDTRFILVLDPDFYIVRRNWIRDVLTHMKSNNLSFLGSTWHPRKYTKYRYFPSVHCMFVDLSKVDKETLDFTPELKKAVFLRKILNRLKVPDRARAYLLVGKARDTGHRIYRRYSKSNGHISECLVPVCHFNNDVSENRGKKFIKRLLPERFSLLPKRKGYYSDRSILKEDFQDLFQLGWEEFLWNDELFAVHLRKFGRKKFLDLTELRALQGFVGDWVTAVQRI